MKPKVKCQDQTQQIKPDQSNKLVGTKKLACHHEETQTKRQRYTEECCQTVRVRLETTAAQTLDSGIDTDSDDSDVPKEFKNIKKAAIAKKVIEQKDTIKAKDDQIKMQQDQIKEMAAENGDKDALIKTKQVYIDKLQNRVSELRDELDKPKKANPIIVDKMTKLEDENERLIANIEKLTKQLDGRANISNFELTFIHPRNAKCHYPRPTALSQYCKGKSFDKKILPLSSSFTLRHV